MSPIYFSQEEKEKLVNVGSLVGPEAPDLERRNRLFLLQCRIS